jgi:hypothetical protein
MMYNITLFNHMLTQVVAIVLLFKEFKEYMACLTKNRTKQSSGLLVLELVKNDNVI